MFSVDPYYAFTFFITPKLETSWRFHYIWKSRNNDPPIAFKANNIQPGQAFHFNFGTSYEIVKGVSEAFICDKLLPIWWMVKKP